jgi:hypothetical protein
MSRAPKGWKKAWRAAEGDLTFYLLYKGTLLAVHVMALHDAANGLYTLEHGRLRDPTGTDGTDGAPRCEATSRLFLLV